MILRRPVSLLALVGAACLSLPGCGAAPRAESPLEYAENARKAYQAALDAFFDRDWETARELFSEVKRRYGYSRWARLAELRLADIEFRQDKWAEAISLYKSFLRDYPNDPEVPYARYRVARALFEQASPSFLLGPLEERDLAVVFDAHAALDSYLTAYPSSKHETELRYMYEVVTGVLARHELYVARFYRDQGLFDAAVARLQYCLREYVESGLEPEAMVLLGETYLMMKRRRLARRVLTRVLYDHPESAFVRPATEFLARLGGPDPEVPRAPPPREPPRNRRLPSDPAVRGALVPGGG